MSQIDVDFSQVVTAEQNAEAAEAKRVAAIKAECRAAILAVADETAQMNLAAAASAGLLSAGQMQIWIAALGWVAAMRSEYARAALAGDDPAWPDLPEGVADLVGHF
jgi:hypothetical protein